jgi:hypothetical protein
MAGAGIQSLTKLRAQLCAADCGNTRHLARIAKNKITVARNATVKSLGKFESGLPQARCKIQYIRYAADCLLCLGPKLYTNGLD